MEKLLEINDLSVTFKTSDKTYNIIQNLNLYVRKGETLGIVGESGSGKSVTSLAIMGLLPEKITKLSGEILFEDKNLIALDEKQMCKIRGNEIAMVFQEPMTSLNPLKTCGKQVMESILLHNKNMTKQNAKDKAIELFNLCGIPVPEQRFFEYPHQMSGGMRQRVMISIALACSPKLLIADEPTTALDVTIQAQILKLLYDIKKSTDMGVILITHDLGVVSETCDRVVIMYCGQIVESATVKEIFEDPKHPYTVGLINAMPNWNTTDKKLQAIDGMVPDFSDMPVGCRFNPRCQKATERCIEEMPELVEHKNRMVRCFLYE